MSNTYDIDALTPAGRQRIYAENALLVAACREARHKLAAAYGHVLVDDAPATVAPVEVVPRPDGSRWEAARVREEQRRGIGLWKLFRLVTAGG